MVEGGKFRSYNSGPPVRTFPETNLDVEMGTRALVMQAMAPRWIGNCICFRG